MLFGSKCSPAIADEVDSTVVKNTGLREKSDEEGCGAGDDVHVIELRAIVAVRSEHY